MIECSESSRDRDKNQTRSVHAWLPGFIYVAFTSGAIVAVPMAILMSLEFSAHVGVSWGVVIGAIVGLGVASLEHWTTNP